MPTSEQNISPKEEENPIGHQASPPVAPSSSGSSPALPSVENLLPRHIFEQLMLYNPAAPGPGDHTPRYQGLTTPLLGSGISQSSTTQSSPFTLLSQPQPSTVVESNELPAQSSSRVFVSRQRSLSAPSGSGGAPPLGESDAVAMGSDYNEEEFDTTPNVLSDSTTPASFYDLDDEHDSHQFVHWPQRGSGMSNRWRARSSSPIFRAGQSTHLSNRRPKTRKVWTEFEREAIREHCQWLLSQPAYQGQSVLPSDLDTWEGIKNALWEKYPRKFQRSRKGIMELARRMGLRQSVREDLQSKQDNPRQRSISRSQSAEI